MDLPICKMKNVEVSELKRESPLDNWFFSLVQKRISELSLLDISRMLRQHVYTDIAVNEAYKILLKTQAK